MMNHNDKIYIAGHAGLVGSAIIRKLKSRGFTNLVTRTRRELDLTNQAEVKFFFEKVKPSYVILAAAKVGGIFANNQYPADFIYENIMIEANVINASYASKVKRLLFLGSTCIYPKESSQPIKEDELMNGPLEATNEPYAIAKISGIKLCESYNRQYQTDFRSIMPTNLYGINDNFHSQNSHVIPALIKRFHKAKLSNEAEVVVWGSGSAMREFLYVDDMASASLFVLNMDKKIYSDNSKPMLSHINVGSGEDMTIKELAETIKKVVGFQGKIIYDVSKPDGTLRKVTDVSKLSKMGWKYKVNLEVGLGLTYEWFVGQGFK
jgi:GDP-L-fucose synthase